MRVSIRSLWLAGLIVTSVSLISITGCGDDDDDDGDDGGTGGTRAGSGGRAGGTGGTTGGRAGGTGGTSAGTGGRTGGTGGTTGGTDGGAGDGGLGGDPGGAGGDGGTDGGAGSGGDGGEGGDSGFEATCAGYCSAIAQGCTTADRQYPEGANESAQCLRTCESFPTTEGANSFACRLEEAVLATADPTNPEAHCDTAGPAGLGACGGACEGYCNLMLEYCPAEFADRAACLSACAALPDANLTNYVYPAPANAGALHCRIAHATNAALYDEGAALRATHCGHAAGEAICD